MPNYEFKPIAELVRAGAFAFLTYVVQQAAAFDEANLDNWQEFAVAFMVGAIAYVSAAILGAITKPDAEDV
jgi:hypothetical protein